MSFFDDMRSLSSDLFTEFGTAATLTNTTKAYNKVLDTVTETSSNVSCLAILSTRRTANDNGIVATEQIATLNKQPASGDKLIMGNVSYNIQSVETVSPDGGEGISYKAVLK